MPADKHFTDVELSFGGQALPDLLRDVLEIEISQSLSLPDMCTIQIKDGGAKFQWVDHASFDIGTPVEIKFKVESGGQVIKGTLFKGEITALEPTFLAAGRTALVVRGYSKAHRLHRGRHTRTFLNASDSDLVRKLAQEAGLQADADPTNVVYPWLLQNNQTNMEFLQERAARIGYAIWVADGKLCFKKAGADRGAAPTLKFGEALYRFAPRLATTHQANKVTVRGWDPKAKEAIEATATQPAALNQGGIKKTGGDLAAAAFGAAEVTVTDRPVITGDDAKALATGLSTAIARDVIHAEGSCAGDPRVQAGCTVSIEGVGDRFSGKYQITAATHHWTPAGYETTFSISGREPDTFGKLLAGDDEAASGLMRGVVPAVVTNLNDPDNLGRVKVRFSALDAQVESDWIRIAAPMAGADRGFCALPEVGDEALVAFEHGDPHRPYAVGFLWNSKDAPPKAGGALVESGRVKKRAFKSKSGHLIILDDTPGSENITIRDKTGKNEIVIKSPDNSMQIAAQGNLTIQAQGNLTFKAQGNVKIEGVNVQLQAQAQASLAGATVSAQAQGQAQLSGAMVQIQGNGPVQVQGNPIMLN